MAWTPWRRAEPPPVPEPPPPADDDAPPDLDVNSLFIDLPPNVHEPDASDPRWMVTPDPAQQALSHKRDDYVRVDVSKLRREREQREHGQRFWQRLRRGEIDARDLPGQQSASNLFFRFADSLFSPFRAAAENPGILLLVILTAIGFTAAFKVIIDFVRAQFGMLS